MIWVRGWQAGLLCGQLWSCFAFQSACLDTTEENNGRETSNLHHHHCPDLSSPSEFSQRIMFCGCLVCNVCGCRWRQRAQCERSFIGGCRAVMMTNEDDSDLHSIIYNTWNGHCTGWSGTMWISNYSISFHGQSQRSTKTSRCVQVKDDDLLM